MEVANSCDVSFTPCGVCDVCRTKKRRARRRQRKERDRRVNQIRKKAHKKKGMVTQLYGDACYLCGGPADTIDHVIPLSRGGTNDIDNLRPACYDCNVSKGSQLIEEMNISA